MGDHPNRTNTYLRPLKITPRKSMGNKTSIGYTFTYPFRFSQQDVLNFAEATGDKNPIHLDEDYARQSIFKTRIIHGFLAGSIFSKVFGTVFPGQGTIFLKQDMSFFKPMYIDTNYTATFTTLKIWPDEARALIKTEVSNEDNKITISGEALIKNEIYRLVIIG